MKEAYYFCFLATPPRILGTASDFSGLILLWGPSLGWHLWVCCASCSSDGAGGCCLVLLLQSV